MKSLELLVKKLPKRGGGPNDVYHVSQPSALPPEMTRDVSNYDVVDHGFISGYNKAIADAKVLGCKAIKLPAGTIVNGFPMVITQEVINYLHHQGFTVEGE